MDDKSRSRRRNCGALVAVCATPIPAAAHAQNSPLDWIEAIERQIRGLQGKLQQLKSEPGETRQQLRQSRNEAQHAQDQLREPREAAEQSRQDALRIAASEARQAAARAQAAAGPAQPRDRSHSNRWEGGSMKRFAASAAMILGLVGATYATDASADDTTVTQAAPAAATQAPPQPASCGSLEDFFVTSCPLTWYGITAYGTIDMGVTWQSRGTPFGSQSPPGDEYLLSKNSNRSGFRRAPNQLTQSSIGIKGDEEIVPDWKFVFDLEAGFDPYSFRLADGPGSIAHNAGTPLDRQTSNTDSSRAGQFYNGMGYLGLSSPTYGTLTLFRQNTLTLDGVFANDPLTASYAFSPLGYQGTTCGVGNTEDCRFSTALKYRVTVGPLRAAALWQFGGYGLNNAADGAYQFQLGGDISDVAGGTVSLDAIYSHVKDAVAVSLAGNTLPALLPQVLTATISDNTSWMALARFNRGPATLYAGYEWIQFANPSHPKSSFTDISGNFLCIGCAGINNTNIVNTAFAAHDKILQIFWVGAKYAISERWQVMGGYYEYLQNSYGAGTPCADTSKPTCSGMYNAISIVLDYQFAPKFDAYAGVMYQTVDAGLANGFLHRNTINPGVGLRFRF
jgi:predicted porin